MRRVHMTAVLTAVVFVAGISPAVSAATGAHPTAADRLLSYVKSHHLACMQCHAIDHRVVGPAWLGVAKKYKNDPQAVSELTTRIANGCGHGPHASQARIPRTQAKMLARFILELAKR